MMLAPFNQRNFLQEYAWPVDTDNIYQQIKLISICDVTLINRSNREDV